MQKGYCQFASRNYEGAYQSFTKASRDPQFATPNTFYSAAQAVDLARNDSAAVLALLDSCIAHTSTPPTSKDAPYYLARYQRLIASGQYRKAVMDLNEYEKAIGPKNLTANFYYLRSQAEMQAHMYQQALDDTRTAIATSSTPLPFRINEAYILLEVGEYQQALDAAQKLLKDLPENPDCYRIMGVSYGELGQKQKAKENLLKAQQLGDEEVGLFLEKYK